MWAKGQRIEISPIWSNNFFVPITQLFLALDSNTSENGIIVCRFDAENARYIVVISGIPITIAQWAINV